MKDVKRQKTSSTFSDHEYRTPASASLLSSQYSSIPQEPLLEDEFSHTVTFASLGLCPALVASCHSNGWLNPTRIQAATIPVVKDGRDVVGLANTGSGKTGAYVLPLVDWLLRSAGRSGGGGMKEGENVNNINGQKRNNFHQNSYLSDLRYLSILVLVPTRELAQQVTAQFLMLGHSIGIKCTTLVGGNDMVSQACELALHPHVVVGTPGRVKDHLMNTKGFALKKLHALVIDECDRMLELDYQQEIDAILEHLPHLRQTLLFSATLNAKIDRLQRASLRNPVMLEVHRNNTTVESLTQQYIFAPFAQMIPHLHYFLTMDTINAEIATEKKKKEKNEKEQQQQHRSQHVLLFCQTGIFVQRLTLVLRILGHEALPLMGKMSQENRILALDKFREGKIRILVCTDLAQRGLDIIDVDTVINFSLPLTVKDYIHRVGRTARAGSSGRAINLISQYDIEQLQTIEKTIGMQMKEWRPASFSPSLITSASGVPPSLMVLPLELLQRVEDAEYEAMREMREQTKVERCEKDELRDSISQIAKRARQEKNVDQYGNKSSHYERGDNNNNNINNKNNNRQRNGRREGGGWKTSVGGLDVNDQRGGGGGRGEGDYGLLRMRKENEVRFGMVKKMQRKMLEKKRRGA